MKRPKPRFKVGQVVAVDLYDLEGKTVQNTRYFCIKRIGRTGSLFADVSGGHSFLLKDLRPLTRREAGQERAK